MKFASFLTFASFAVSAVLAQSIDIGFPLPNTRITPGKNITVQVIRPDSLQSSINVGMVISMLQCSPNVTCPSPSEILGNVLYTGSFDPEFPPFFTGDNQPQQNFSVQVPSDFVKGRQVQLAVTLLTLIGAGPSPLVEFANETLIVK
ncbi:hypothetical protein V8E53_006815 [Lactarius tabidus]